MESDDFLNRSLQSYARGELPADMEWRVMRRIATARARRVRGWSLVGLAAAGALAIVGVRSPVPPPVAHEPLGAATRRELVAEAHASLTPPAVRSRVKHRVPERPFPSAAPLTNDERALLTFAVSAPPEEVSALIRSQETGLQPIEIDPIEVEALEPK